MKFWKRTILLAVLSTFFMIAGIAQAQDYYFRFTNPPAQVYCSNINIPHIETSSFVMEYNIPLGASVNTYLASNGGAAAFVGSVNGLGFAGSKTISNFFAPASGFPFSVTLRYDVVFAGQTLASSAMTFSCDQATVTKESLAGAFGTSTSSASSTGTPSRINPQSYAPIGLFCSGSVLSAYVFDGPGVTFGWSRDLSLSAAPGVLINRAGSALSRTADGRYSVSVQQADGKQYVFVFNGCPDTGTTESYVSDPATGKLNRLG